MKGWAVELRCPYTRMVLGKLSIPPGVTALDERKCGARECRKAERWWHYYEVCDGKARPLTDEERSAIVGDAVS